jgi:putative glutamine amidotransferase
MKPIIAITPEAISLSRTDGRGTFCGVSYSQAIEAVGGVPFVLPLTRDTAVLDELLPHCHGLLLSGGGDPSERFYCPVLTDAERATLSGVDEVRDEMEVYLVREALDARLPVLGICRGMQMLNLAMGGTLIADIPTRLLQRPRDWTHANPNPEEFAHELQWERTSRLWDMLGHGCESVNSHHHQAVDQIAPGFEVAARATDGVVEAIESIGAGFAVGVQFHPERLLRVGPQFLRLFEVFVEASGRRQQETDVTAANSPPPFTAPGALEVL